MPLNRSLPRNVFIYDATNPDEILGGLVQNGSITEANFLDILGILLVVDGSLTVEERISSRIVSRTEVPLETGVYDVHSDGTIQVNDEAWVNRMISHNVSGRDVTFRHRIRNRDRKCVISGAVNPEILIQADNWAGYEAAHIFPLEHESRWIEWNYGRWITDMDDAPGSSKINSSQNGILLQSTVHDMFDRYLISINPDDCYKVVVFDIDRFGLDGRILDPVCRSRADPHRASKNLLRWHFRQSVLANMRGAGETIFEDDFQPSTDMVGGIPASPYAQERSGLEMPSMLRGIS